MVGVCNSVGLHYLQISSIQFHRNRSVSVGSMVWNSLTALSKCGLNSTDFQKMCDHSVHFVCISCTISFLYQMQCVDSKFKISIVYSQLLNIIMWKVSVPHFTQIGKEVWETWVELFCALKWSMTHYAETHTVSTNMWKKPLYWIL